MTTAKTRSATRAVNSAGVYITSLFRKGSGFHDTLVCIIDVDGKLAAAVV